MSKLLTQAAPVQSIDVENRTVDVVFSTGDLVRHPVLHQGRFQVMPTRVVLERDAVDLEQLKAGPVLNSHNEYDIGNVIGSVVDAWLERGVAMARLQFSAAPDVEPIWQRVAEGHVRNVSMGFRPLQQEVRQEDSPEGPIDVMTFTRWQPFEISVVARGADKGARIQSADAVEESAAAAATTSQDEEMDMADNQQGAAVQAQSTEAAQAVSVSGASNSAPFEATQAAADPSALVQAERERVLGIQEVAQKLGVSGDLAQAAVRDGTSLDDFRARAIDAFAQRGQEAVQGVGGPRATVTEDAHDRFRQGATLGLMARVGMEGGERNEFTGMTLSELARQSLSVAGVRAPADRREMVGRSFVQAGAHSTSDFTSILSDVMNKSTLRGWEEAEETFQSWTRAGTASDFKPTKRVDLGMMDALPEIPEGANYTYGTIGDRGEQVVIATYGRMLRITRQAIINDDLAMFTDLPRKMGRAARRTIGNMVYAVLTGNPTMSDGVALFHADHNNLASSGAAPSVTSLSAGRTAMRLQKESAGGPSLNIMPKYMIVPAALETTARQLLTSAVEPTANKGHAANPVAGMAELIVDGRLDASSSASWFLAADPNAFDTIEVTYLDGVQAPYIEEQTAWSSDGVELKVRIDAGVTPLDFRTLYKDPGA